MQAIVSARYGIGLAAKSGDSPPKIPDKEAWTGKTRFA
jgi:hypothetical protein